MNQKFINTVMTSALLIGGIAATSLQANAAGFHEGSNNNGIAISTTQFNALLSKTNMDHLGYNFGAPDEIQTLKNTTGTRVGSVWVYHDAVQKDGNKQDVRFVIIGGKLQYATVSNAS